MTGPVMVIGGEYKFHPECFKCSSCNAIIGDDESYAYIDHRQLFCNNCLQKQTINSLDKSVRFCQPKQSDQGKGVIQLVEILPISNGKKHRMKLTLKDYQHSHCYTLFIGDDNGNIIH